MLDPRIQEVVTEMGSVYASDATPEAVKAWVAALATKLLSTAGPLPGLNKGDPLPRNMGAQADLYAEVRAARLEAEKYAGLIKERETELYKLILSQLQESPDTGAAGMHYRVQMVVKQRQNVKDWPTFHQFVQQTGAFEMLQKRLSDKAVQEYRDDKGALPPGVEEVDVDTLSFTKV